jgi:ABC-2 type transport system ATP-binding protein
MMLIEREGRGVSDAMVQVDGLVKVYDGKVRAVDGISLSIAPGEIFGLLGPNGAGKSTTIKILVTLVHPDAGTVRVAGHDALTEPDAVRSAIGYVSQDVAVDKLISGRENLELLAHLYHLPHGEIAARVSEVLDVVELGDRADDVVKGYSGGMKKRLDIAGGLLHRPRLLVLDEPTLGLDIQTRVRIWEMVRAMKAKGTTVLVTTHYLEEADQLCDRVGIIDHGKIQALGTPAELKSQLGGDCVELAFERAPGAEVAAGVRGITGVRDVQAGDGLTVWVENERAVGPILAHLAANNQPITKMSYARSTLEEVFLRHTGRKMRD